MTKVTIKRFNPEVDKEAYYQSYDIDIQEGMTILELLAYIKDKIDATLTYRAFCRSAICGSCAMKINGRAQLACKIQAEDKIKNEQIIIEPLGNFPIVKDLVVDQEKSFEKFKQVKPWLEPDRKKVPRTDKSESLVSPEEFAMYDKQTDCILCMACYGSCNANEGNENYIGPFQLTKAFRFIQDSRDGMDIEGRLEVLKEDGIWDCVQCQMCLAACPKGIKPADDIQELRRISIDFGDESMGAKRATSWFKDVYTTGQIDKFNLPVNAKGDVKARENMEKEFRERGIPEERFEPKPFDGIEFMQKFIRKIEGEEI